MSVLVRGNELYAPKYPSNVILDTNTWFEWLEENKSFRFECSFGNISIIKDERNYWTASKKVEGELRRKRLGVSRSITYQKLVDSAKLICIDALWKDYKGKRKSTTKKKELDSSFQAEKLRTELQKQAEEIACLGAKLEAVSQNYKCVTEEIKAVRAVVSQFKNLATNGRGWTHAKKLIEAIEAISLPKPEGGDMPS
jgi:hypothetical protein